MCDGTHRRGRGAEIPPEAGPSPLFGTGVLSPPYPCQGEGSSAEEGGEHEQPAEAVRGERGLPGPALAVPVWGTVSSLCPVLCSLQAAVQRANLLESLLEQQRQLAAE